MNEGFRVLGSVTLLPVPLPPRAEARFESPPLTVARSPRSCPSTGS